MIWCGRYGTAGEKPSWEEFCCEMKEVNKANQKLFYRILKWKRKQYDLKYVLRKNERTLTERNEMMEKWKEYIGDAQLG